MMKLKRYNDQNGMALVICLLVMTVVAMIGVGVMTDSTIEIKIAANHKNKAISFSNADLGSKIAPKIIEDNIFEAGWSSSDPKWDSSEGAYKYCETPLIYVHENSFATLTRYIPTTEIPYRSDSPGAITITSDDINTTVDISKTGKLATGAAIQMAAGYEGVGKGAAGGGYHAYFRCNGSGTTPNNTATTTVENYYRYVPK